MSTAACDTDGNGGVGRSNERDVAAAVVYCTAHHAAGHCQQPAAYECLEAHRGGPGVEIDRGGGIGERHRAVVRKHAHDAVVGRNTMGRGKTVGSAYGSDGE